MLFHAALHNIQYDLDERKICFESDEPGFFRLNRIDAVLDGT